MFRYARRDYRATPDSIRTPQLYAALPTPGRTELDVFCYDNQFGKDLT